MLYKTKHSYAGTKAVVVELEREQWALHKAAASLLAKARVLNHTCIAASEDGCVCVGGGGGILPVML